MKAEYITPAVTLFDSLGHIDRAGSGQLYENLIRNGVDGILVLGSAGEFFGMSLDQRRELAQFALEKIGGRTKVLIGTGGGSLEETVLFSNEVLAAGADGVMVIGPYYIDLSPEHITSYFSEAAGRVEGEVYLYNYPARTGYDLTPEMTRELLRKHDNVIGYKDTVPLMSHTRDLLNLILPEFPEFNIYCGYDENFAHTVLSGGKGCIGALSNLVPDWCRDWVRAFRELDLDKAAAVQKKINRLMPLYSISSPFIPVMKAALALTGLDAGTSCTFPLDTASEHQIDLLRTLLLDAGVLPGPVTTADCPDQQSVSGFIQ